MAQLEIEFEERNYPLTLKQLGFHTVFRKQGSAAAYMKVKAVNYLCNSNLITDVINRGDCLVVNLHKGTCFVMEGSTPVVKYKGKMSLTIDKD